MYSRLLRVKYQAQDIKQDEHIAHMSLPIR